MMTDRLLSPPQMLSVLSYVQYSDYYIILQSHQDFKVSLCVSVIA